MGQGYRNAQAARRKINPTNNLPEEKSG